LASKPPEKQQSRTQTSVEARTWLSSYVPTRRAAGRSGQTGWGPRRAVQARESSYRGPRKRPQRYLRPCWFAPDGLAHRVHPFLVAASSARSSAFPPNVSVKSACNAVASRTADESQLILFETGYRSTPMKTPWNFMYAPLASLHASGVTNRYHHLIIAQRVLFKLCGIASRYPLVSRGNSSSRA